MIWTNDARLASTAIVQACTTMSARLIDKVYYPMTIATDMRKKIANEIEEVALAAGVTWASLIVMWAVALLSN